MDLLIYTDGASRGNPGKAAWGFSICTAAGERLTERSGYMGTASNNVAEYTAIIAALKAAASLSRGKVTCISDSQLVVNQLAGNWKIKKPHLKVLHTEAKKLEKQFASVTYRHVQRETPQIARVDRMINHELDKH